jgi:NAD(P)H-hydrate repair Nnr-like enzyme with NAD(P)H-hydrate epimerase domain
VHAVYGTENDRVAVGLVGSGNNGGDTLVALAALSQSGWQAHAYLAVPGRRKIHWSSVCWMQAAKSCALKMTWISSC